MGFGGVTPADPVAPGAAGPAPRRDDAALPADRPVELPAEYPADLEREARTRSGGIVRCRPIRPDDAPALVAFHAALSSRTIYLRYFGFHPVLTAAEVERFTQVDYVDRVAFVALVDSRIVGVGRYDRTPGTDEAEVAFIVDDDYQHQGIGSLLADELVRAARRQGVRQFVADTLAENSGMLELFHSMGFPVRSAFENGVVRVRFLIDDVPGYVQALARREAGRALVDGGPDDGGGSC